MSILGIVSAFEEEGNINDGIGDVIDTFKYEVVSENKYVEIDNIDITKFTYTITDNSFVFSIEVKGVIENRGDMSDLNMDSIDEDSFTFDIDAVGYSFTLSTSKDYYVINYVNGECQLLTDTSTINLTSSDFSISGNKLTINYDLDTTGQVFESAIATSTYIRWKFDINDLINMTEEDLDKIYEDIVTLTDEAPNEPLSVFSTAPSNGNVDETMTFNASAMFGIPPYSYSWDFGDGSTSNLQNATHKYSKNGTYNYVLTVTDSDGTIETDSGSIVISEDSINDNNNNDNEQNGENEESGFLLFVGVIAIIIIIGIIVVVLIIRR
jgi:hypothetical protein